MLQLGRKQRTAFINLQFDVFRYGVIRLLDQFFRGNVNPCIEVAVVYRIRDLHRVSTIAALSLRL